MGRGQSRSGGGDRLSGGAGGLRSTLVRSAIVLGVLLVTLTAVLGRAAAVVMAPVGDDRPDRGVDAVVALAGGESQRLDVASKVAESTGSELVLSWVPGAESDRDDRCAEGHRCFVPDPVNTTGEARAIGELATEQGWRRVAVVTSRHHVGRAGMLIGQCVDGVEVDVVSATGHLTRKDLVEETLAVLAGATLLRAC